MPETKVRPSQVTIVVVLIWFSFALTVIAAIATIIAGTLIASSDPAAVLERLREYDLPESWGSTAGPVAIVSGGLMFVIAIIEAIFAVAISRGSNIARILLTIFIAFRILVGLLFIVTSWGTSGFLFGTFLAVGLDIIVLLLLFNHASNEYFTNEVKRA